MLHHNIYFMVQHSTSLTLPVHWSCKFNALYCNFLTGKWILFLKQKERALIGIINQLGWFSQLSDLFIPCCFSYRANSSSTQKMRISSLGISTAFMSTFRFLFHLLGERATQKSTFRNNLGGVLHSLKQPWHREAQSISSSVSSAFQGFPAN